MNLKTSTVPPQITQATGTTINTQISSESLDESGRIQNIIYFNPTLSNSNDNFYSNQHSGMGNWVGSRPTGDNWPSNSQTEDKNALDALKMKTLVKQSCLTHRFPTVSYALVPAGDKITHFGL